MTVVADTTLKAWRPRALGRGAYRTLMERGSALDDVSFDIAPASFAVLLGLNGAGKSTLFLGDHARSCEPIGDGGCAFWPRRRAQ